MSQRARIAGTELCFDVAGQGPSVLFLHAFPLDGSSWDACAQALRPLYQVVRFDARGFGGTPTGGAPLGMERIAADAVALCDHLGISQAVVVGCSMGGYAAFALQRQNPERLRGLVLCDTRAEPDTAESRQARALLAEDVRRRGPVAAADAFLPKLVGETTRRERPAVVADLRERILRASAQGLVDGLIGLAARADSQATLREIRVPTLVLCGEEDALTPPQSARALQAGIAGSRLRLLPGVGHLPMLEDPAALNTVLREFLDGLE